MDKATFLRRINSPLLFRLFLIWKLPAAWFMGIQVAFSDGNRAVIRLPYGWRSQNPFRSIYFAAQCGAAEMSTGLLALAALQDRPPVSMLVVKMEAEFYKKAAAPLLFTCEEGPLVETTIQQAIDSGQAQVLRLSSVGRLPDGSEAARVWVTWSFKRK